jgi:hypothetical protein
MPRFLARILGQRRAPKRASAHPGPSERARLRALKIEKTRQMRFELGLPWRI